MISLKAIYKPARVTAAVLVVANTALGQATGHPDLKAVAVPVLTVLLTVGVIPLWKGVLSLFGKWASPFALLLTAVGLVVGVAAKLLSYPAVQIALFGWVSLAQAGGLCANLWGLARHSSVWLSPWAMLTNPGPVLANSVGLIALTAVLVGVPILVVQRRARKKSQPGKDAVYETELEKLLAPKLSDVKHLLVEAGSGAEATRPYIADAMVRSTKFGRETWPIVPLHLPAGAAGIGVFGVSGMGKGAHTVANGSVRPSGEHSPFADGHGMGFIGPQVVASNAKDICDSLAWRIAMATAYLRRLNGGAEPSLAEVRSMVAIYDPAGVLAANPIYSPYRQGWSPLDGVTNEASANVLASALCAEEQTIVNQAYFASPGIRITSAFLMAAKRGGKPLSQIARWADAIQHPGNQVIREVERILMADGASAEEQGMCDKLKSSYVRVMETPGERSAVWGTIEKALRPFSTAAVNSSTTPSENPNGMIDAERIATTPYGMTYVVMPPTMVALEIVRPVFVALLSELVQVAEDLAATMPHGGLTYPLTFTLDELESTRVMPKLPENLVGFRKYNMKIIWLSQTYGGLQSCFSPHQMAAISSGTTVKLTLSGYGSSDEHLKKLVEEIGSRTITRVSKNKRKGEDGGESSTQDRVQLVDVARLSSALRPGMMLLQTSGPAAGLNVRADQLRPFIVRQHRAAAHESELEGGMWVDPVLNARLMKGSAAGVAPEERPDDRGWMRLVQQVRRWARGRAHRPAKP